MTSFYEMVSAECNGLDEVAQRDAAMLARIRSFVDDAESRRNGQTVSMNGAIGTIAYKGTQVARFSVLNGQCRYQSPDSDWCGPLGERDAIFELARIVAIGIRRRQNEEERAA